MATNAEMQGASLHGSGGATEPLDRQAGVKVAGGKLGSIISRRLQDAFFRGESGEALVGARERILQRQQQAPAGESASVSSDPQPAGAAAPVEEPTADAPAAADPEPVQPQPEEQGLESPAEAADPSSIEPPAARPAQFDPVDRYDRYIKVDDDDVDGVMKAPEKRDELLGKGLSDFNDAKIPDEDGIQERIEAISLQYEGKISADKRGKISHETTRQLADLIGTSQTKLHRAILSRERGQVIEFGGAGLAETMLAARDLMVAEMRKLDRIAARAEDGGPEELAQFRYQMELVANLQRNIKGSQTEIARALSGYRIDARDAEGITDPVMREQQKLRERRDYTRLLEDYGGAENIRTLAKKYNELDAPHQRAQMARGAGTIKKIGDAIYEVWQHTLLTGMITQTKNIVGNVLTTFVMPNVEGVIAIGVGKTKRLLGSQEPQFTGADLNARLFGQIMSIREAFAASGRAFIAGKSEFDGSKIVKGNTERVAAFSGEAFDQHGAIGTAIDVMGNILTMGRVAYRSLEAGDTFFKAVSHRATLYEEALRTGQSRGFRGEELSEYIADFVTNPPAVALDEAIERAKHVTLQTDLDKVGRSIQNIGSLPLVRYFVPFLKTPYNSAKYSFIDRTPLGFAMGKTQEMIRAGGKQADEAYARVALGSAVSLTMFSMVATGECSGGGPANHKLKALLRTKGWQPYSCKIGGQWISYAGTEPIASIFGLAADIAEVSLNSNINDEDGPDFATEIAPALISASLYNVSNKTFMQGFNNLVAMTQDPTRYTGTTLEKFQSTVVPRVVAQWEKLDDPVIRDAQTMVERWKAQIPGLSADLNPRVAINGEDMHSGNYDPNTQSYNLAVGPDVISPFRVSAVKEDPVADLGLRLGGITLTPAASSLAIPRLDKPVGLTDDERYWYQKRAHTLGWENLTAVAREWNKDPHMRRMLTLADKNKNTREALKVQLQKIWMHSRKQAQLELLEHPRYGRAIQRHISELERAQETQNDIIEGAM